MMSIINKDWRFLGFDIITFYIGYNMPSWFGWW